MGSEVLLPLRLSLGKLATAVSLLQNGAPFGNFCPGLLGTSREGVGGCEYALKVLTATLLVSQIPRKLIWSPQNWGKHCQGLRS